MDSDRMLDPLPGSHVPLNTNRRIGGPALPRKTSLAIWMGAIWTCAAHCFLSVGASAFVLFCVADHHFNVTERAPVVHAIGETQVTPFSPTQSDITTILSSIVTILKCALAAWAASLCWNAALFLMERRGLARRDLKVLLKYGLLCPGAYSKDWSAAIVGALLLTSLIAGLSSPVLTGAITWLPSNRLVHNLSIPPAGSEDVLDGSLTQLLPVYYNQFHIRELTTMVGVGRVVRGWGRKSDKGTLKRVSLTAGELAVNSTIQNVTLPHFQVHSIRWVESRNEIPGIKDGTHPLKLLRSHFDMAPSNVSGFPPGCAVLVPNITTNWSSDPLETSIIRDTRLLVLYYAFDDREQPSGIFSLVSDLPLSAYKLSLDNRYYAFAWVTFSAGIGRCKEYNCIISSPSTIQNNTPVELEPHQLTFQALSMAPVVGVWLVRQNTSIPYPWISVDDYVEQVLVRSYSGAWSGLNLNMQTSTTIMGYVPSLPSLLAVVSQSRVYIWLGIQLLVTLLSVLFLVVQSRLSKYPVVGDTYLVAFNLDTTDVMANDLVTGVRKVEQRGRQMIVKSE